VELGPKGVTVNTISAGVVDTEALNFFPSKDLIIETTRARTPNGRIVTPEEVADVAVFLASPLARGITGQTIVVDNGYSVVA
jgi:enoyl-[acyl-carrier protein] reductase III